MFPLLVSLVLSQSCAGGVCTPPARPAAPLLAARPLLPRPGLVVAGLRLNRPLLAGRPRLFGRWRR